MLPTAVLLLVQPQAPAFRADLEAGRYLKVLAEAEPRLRQDPNDASAWAAKSQALSSLLRFTEARAAADRALTLRPGLADALLARGLARAGEAIRQRDVFALRGALNAMDDLRAATEADPALAPAWTSLGLAYEMLPGLLGGSTRQALQCADRLRRVAPARGDLLQALILVEEDKWREAEPCFQRALAQAPQDPEVVGQWLDALDRRLDTLETLLTQLVQQRAVKDWYTTAEAAQLLGKAEFTVREWCRLGRVNARKRACGRGRAQEWAISHQELQRIRNEGLLPQPRTSTRIK